MCTIALAYRMCPDSPILVAANRDEIYDRPAAPPAWRTDGPIPVFAPKDLERGGTWIGVNAAGVFAGLTNRYTEAEYRSPISRGAIVLHALTEHTAERAAAVLLRTMDPARYRPFHCMIADGSSAHLVWHTGTEIRTQRLASGLHVVTQWSLGACPEDRNVRRFFPTAPDASAAEFRTALAQHDLEHPYDGTCVHRPEHGYGSRSSSLITFASGGRIAYAHADGPPCQTKWQQLVILSETKDPAHAVPRCHDAGSLGVPWDDERNEQGYSP